MHSEYKAQHLCKSVHHQGGGSAQFKLPCSAGLIRVIIASLYTGHAQPACDTAQSLVWM